MFLSRRHLLMVTALAASAAFVGCMSDPGMLPVSRDTPFVLNIPEHDKPAFTARLQQTEWQQPPPRPPSQTSGPTQTLQPASLTKTNTAPPNVRVRAWVNGKPIFDDEVAFSFGPQLKRIMESVPPTQREAEQQKALAKALDALIDAELLMQDAFRRLEKNPKQLEKIRAETSKEVDSKIAASMRQAKAATMEEFKQLVQSQGMTVEGMRRLLEREYIASGYLRSLIHAAIEKVGLREIRDYYDQHRNEYMQVDRVKWQNIFIAVGPKHPSLAQAKARAEQLLQRWAGGEEIARLIPFDDGVAAANQGAGVGEIKGDIRPRELETSLFALKEGEFGPPVEMSTGVHIFRVLKRDYAGVMPFDEKIQTMIGNKLKNEIFEREGTRLARMLREQAVIDIER